jgi:hypothetical protein
MTVPKPFRQLHINVFLQLRSEEGRRYIHLLELVVKLSCE